MAFDEFSLHGIDSGDGIVAVDDREFVIFRETNLHPGISHCFTEEQLYRPKSQIAPVVYLNQSGTFVIHIRLWRVVFPSAGQVNRARGFHSQRMMGANFVVQPPPVLQSGLCFGHIGRCGAQSFQLQRAVEPLDLTLRLGMDRPSVDWKNIQIHQETLKG
mgnify:CR=1 FL=1